MGSVDNDDFFLRRICVDLQISIVNVGYRCGRSTLYSLFALY